MEPSGNKSVATVLPRLDGPDLSGSRRLGPFLSQSARGGGHERRVVQVSGRGVGAGEGTGPQAVDLRVHGG